MPKEQLTLKVRGELKVIELVQLEKVREKRKEQREQVKVKVWGGLTVIG